jgi:hypothetical protein
MTGLRGNRQDRRLWCDWNFANGYGRTLMNGMLHRANGAAIFQQIYRLRGEKGGKGKKKYRKAVNLTLFISVLALLAQQRRDAGS